VLRRWPIRNKLLVGIALLVVILLTMSISSFEGTYAYRELVRSISSRAHELELATDLASQVSDLRVTLADLDDVQRYDDLKLKPSWAPGLNADFSRQLEDVTKTIRQYEVKLNEHEHHDSEIGEPSHERDAVSRTYKCLASIEELTSVDCWYLEAERTNPLRTHLIELQNLGKELPHYLEDRMLTLSRLDRLIVDFGDRRDDFADTFHFTGLPMDLPAAADTGKGLAPRGRRRFRLSDSNCLAR
jgi:hypothetical protein